MNRPRCHFCGGPNVIGNGYHVSDGAIYKRWKCKDCNRTFSKRHWGKRSERKRR